jgi:hypothetical protein
VVSQIGTFYAALNAFLAEHRILRHLRIYVPLPARSGERQPARGRGGIGRPIAMAGARRRGKACMRRRRCAAQACDGDSANSG